MNTETDLAWLDGEKLRAGLRPSSINHGATPEQLAACLIAHKKALAICARWVWKRTKHLSQANAATVRAGLIELTKLLESKPRDFEV